MKNKLSKLLVLILATTMLVGSMKVGAFASSTPSISVTATADSEADPLILDTQSVDVEWNPDNVRHEDGYEIFIDTASVLDIPGNNSGQTDTLDASTLTEGTHTAEVKAYTESEVYVSGDRFTYYFTLFGG
nr:hypothetical protein [Vallitaleaceae bacterium]